ncbi:hypothetical protein ABZU86_00105 [Streptomyces sp. NPDC005271]|uniref:hypothetical protein n=1 Tax=unclassified Streptomyces TaxID=2593676 RepID=UPI0033A227EB
MKPQKLGGLLRRLVRQDSADEVAIRLLPRLVFGVAAAYTLFTIAASSFAALIGVGTLLLLALACWLLRSRGQLLLALFATPVTAAVTGYAAAAGDIARGVQGSAIGGQAVFGYWTLAVMALLGAWMVKDHPGRRGVTVVIADAVLIVAAFVGALVPDVSVPLGFVGLMAVLAVRGRGFTAVWRRMKRTTTAVRRLVARTGADG